MRRRRTVAGPRLRPPAVSTPRCCHHAHLSNRLLRCEARTARSRTRVPTPKSLRNVFCVARKQGLEAKIASFALSKSTGASAESTPESRPPWTTVDGRDSQYAAAPESCRSRRAFRQEKPPGQHLDGRTARCALRSDFGLFGDFQRVIHLDAEIPHGRLQLGVAEQQLHGP